MTREEWNKEFVEFCDRRGWWSEDVREKIAAERGDYFQQYPNNPEEAARDIWILTQGQYGF